MKIVGDILTISNGAYPIAFLKKYLPTSNQQKAERAAAAPTPTPTPTPTPSTTSTDLLDSDIQEQGYSSGKVFGKRHSKEENATPDQIREFARKFADREGYTDEGQARNSFLEGFIDGYYDGAGIHS